MIPLSLYIHIPWCAKKCPYCDFNSHLIKAAVDENAYIDALIEDLECDMDNYDMAIADRPLQSIFIGGGTPSLFSATSIGRLVSAVSSRFALAPDVEITLEANPGSSEAVKFTDFREAGINRLSIGVQSFNGDHLGALGRVHDCTEALAAAGYARQAGFSNFNLDLMFGLPHQTVDQCLEDVAQAIELEPSHLSCYQLTIEPNTLFHHQPPSRPDDETLWEMQQRLQELLHNEAYQQYEVSAYALADRRCQHNLNYWQFGDYLGIGAGAHGKITGPDGELQRYWKVKHPGGYLRARQKADFVGGLEQVRKAQLPFEFMMNALRLTGGFDTKLFVGRTGLGVDAIQPLLADHQQKGLIELNDSAVNITPQGQRFIDTMLQDYLPE